MNDEHSTMEMEHKSHWRTYLPLIIVFLIISFWVIVRQAIGGFSLKNSLYDFMAGFFVIFGSLQIANWKNFANTFSGYDLIASRVRFYAYTFPIIELALAASYLFRFQINVANWVTLVIFSISSIGVLQALKISKDIPCACLGGIFALPLSWVTLLEDLLMAAMALMALL